MSRLKLNTRTDWIPNGFVAASKKHLTGDTDAHLHEFFELEYVLSGSGTCEIDGRPYPMREGTLFLLTPTNVHAVRAADAEIVNVMFRATEGESALPLPDAARSLSLPLGASDADLVRALLSELVAVHEGDLAYAHRILGVLLTKLSRLAGEEARDPLPYVRSAIRYVTEHFRTGITLKSTADHLGLTPTYFSALFRAETGMPFKQYLDGVRFAHAKGLLAFTDLPVSEIHARAGFGDYANFSRRFREAFGVTPSAWRAANRKAR